MNVAKNEPVVIWTAIGALVSALLYKLVPDVGNELVSAIVDVVVLVGPLLAGIVYARSKVTPVSNPHMPDGTPAQLAPENMDVGNG